MGIYYGVANYTKKEYIYDPLDMAVKWPAIFDPGHPLARIILYKISLEWASDKIALVDDCSGFPWHEDGWIDVTEKSVTGYIDRFSYIKNEDFLKGFVKDNFEMRSE